MKGVNRVDRKQLFPLVEGLIMKGINFKVRGRRLEGI